MNERLMRMWDATKEEQGKSNERAFLQRLSSFLKSSVGLNDKDQYFIPDSLKDDKLVVGLGGAERAIKLLNEDKDRKEREEMIRKEEMAMREKNKCKIQEEYEKMCNENMHDKDWYFQIVIKEMFVKPGRYTVACREYLRELRMVK